MGYFENDTFRPIIFDLEKNTGTIYASLDQKPMSSNMPVNWYFGEPYFKGDFDPAWIDETVFWTPSYEVNAETGETSTPRELKRPYNFRWNEYLESPDGSIQVSLNDAEDAILISDTNGTVLASLPVEDLYDGPRQEILTSSFILPGRNLIMGWSPFIPPATR
jgi:hypothetical protein